jgi:TolA-binding protein
MAKMIWRIGKISFGALGVIAVVGLVIYGARILTFAQAQEDPVIEQQVVELLQTAKAHQTNEQYDQAEQIYQTIIEQYPGADYALEAQTDMTTLYIETSDDQAAQNAIETLFTDYATNQNVSEAIWKVAQYYLSDDQEGNAFELHVRNAANAFNDTGAMWSQVEITLYHIKEQDDIAADAAYSELVSRFSSQEFFSREVNKIAQCYLSNARTQEAIDLHKYNAAAFQDKYALWSQVEVVDYYIKTNDAQAADAAYQQLITRFAQDEENLPIEINKLAKRYAVAGDELKALQLHQYNASTYSNSYALWSQSDVVKYYIKVDNELATNSAFTQMVTRFSEEETLPAEINKLAGCYAAVGKQDEAFGLYRYVLAQWPDADYAVWALQGEAISRIEIEDFDGAEAVIAMLKDNFAGKEILGTALNGIGDIYRKALEPEMALGLYTYTLDNCSEVEVALVANVGVGLAQIYLNDDPNDSQVMAVVDTLIAKFNDVARVDWGVFVIGEEYYDLASAMRKQGLKPLAERHFLKAINIWERITSELPVSEHATLAYYYCGMAYNYTGDYEMAVQYYQAVVDQWPDYEYAWDAQFRVGECYGYLTESGKLSKTAGNAARKAAYQKVIQNYPGCKAVAAARTRLSQLK